VSSHSSDLLAGFRVEGGKQDMARKEKKMEVRGKRKKRK